MAFGEFEAAEELEGITSLFLGAICLILVGKIYYIAQSCCKGAIILDLRLIFLPAGSVELREYE